MTNRACTVPSAGRLVVAVAGLAFVSVASRVPPLNADDARVRVVADGDAPRLLVDGKPFEIRGAGLGWIVGDEPNLAIGADGAAVPADPATWRALGDVASDVKRHRIRERRWNLVE